MQLNSRSVGQTSAPVKDEWLTLDLDGAVYSWKIRHGWRVEPGRGIRGVSIAVVREPGRTREAVVDFPFSLFGVDGAPAVSKVLPYLRDAVRQAIEAGWQAESRGRAFRFDWTAPPPT